MAKGSNCEDVHARAKEFFNPSYEMDKRLIRIANMTWDYIGDDTLNCVRDNNPKRTCMKRSEVIEVVCDADYMLTNGRDKEAYAYYLYLRDNHEKHLAKVMKEAFPCKTYGF
jgi:hypothetical protein